MTRVVLDPRTEAHLGQQLEVVQRALLETLGFEQAVLGAKVLEPLPQFGADVA